MGRSIYNLKFLMDWVSLEEVTEESSFGEKDMWSFKSSKHMKRYGGCLEKRIFLNSMVRSPLEYTAQ